MENLGYDKPLYILAFDHRASLTSKMFGFQGELDEDQKNKITEAKDIIFQGLLKGIALGIPKEHAALLVDEEYGAQILAKAKEEGIISIQTTEKSGQEEFDFQYEDFGSHLKNYGATFAKALVRYNPEGDKALNKRQCEKLKVLSDYCHENGLKFLIEPLVAATAEELLEVSGDKQQYDERIRPVLTIRMIKELQEAGVEPDIWKIEGLDKSEDYKKVVEQARASGRDQVSVVVLGRGESRDKVEEWLRAGKVEPGVVGFAIGRTIFWDPLVEYKDGKISKEEAAEKIGQNYFGFYKIFTE